MWLWTLWVSVKAIKKNIYKFIKIYLALVLKSFFSTIGPTLTPERNVVALSMADERWWNLENEGLSIYNSVFFYEVTKDLFWYKNKFQFLIWYCWFAGCCLVLQLPSDDDDFLLFNIGGIIKNEF